METPSFQEPASNRPAPAAHGRHGWRWTWVIIALILVVAAFLVGRGVGPASHGSAGSTQQYHCPMHPTVISDQPGDCPICGMKLVPMKTEATTPAKAAKYHCPMHPTVVSDQPGDCPICGMDLVPMGENAQASRVEPAK